MKVLIIDDADDYAAPVRRLLEIAGAEARRSADGFEGLIVAGDWCPDLILLDIMMPDLDGMEVLRQLRESDFPGKIAMITAVGEHETQAQARELGADDYLIKGTIDLPRLKELLRKFLPAGDSLALELLDPHQQELTCLQSPQAVLP